MNIRSDDDSLGRRGEPFLTAGTAGRIHIVHRVWRLYEFNSQPPTAGSCASIARSLLDISLVGELRLCDMAAVGNGKRRHAADADGDRCLDDGPEAEPGRLRGGVVLSGLDSNLSNAKRGEDDADESR